MRARTLLGALECLRSGMTTIQDMLTLYPFEDRHLDAVMAAYDEIGIRVVFSLQYADRKGIETIPYWKDIFPKELHRAALDRGRAGAAARPARPFRDDVPEGAAAPARALGARPVGAGALLAGADGAHHGARAPLRHPGLFPHLRIARHGAAGAAHLAGAWRLADQAARRRRRLDPRLNLAHSVWLARDEIDLLAEPGTGVVLNPQGNLKMKCGIPPIRALQDAGVRIGLGCDNCSCSDAQNMFVAMKLFALLAAVSDPIPGPPQAANALQRGDRGRRRRRAARRGDRTHRAGLQGRSDA